LATHHVEIVLGENAQLTLYRVQSDTADGILLTRIDIEIAAHARLAAVCVDAGAGFCRHDLNAQLNGPGAEIELNGLYHPISHAAAGETPRRTHIDNHTCIVHAQPHGRSRESFRGIVDARARAVFNGKVVVMPDAQKTDSEQRIATLLLSRRAEANAKPELEIHADDVRCAHGATVGQLDATALAYLRSRGIDPATARTLLLQAFAMQILDKIAIPSLRADLCRRLGLPGDDGAVETLPLPLANPAIPA